VRDVNLTVRVTRDRAEMLYACARETGRKATDLHREALYSWLDAMQPVEDEYTPDLVAGYVGLNVEREILISQGADEDDLLKPLAPEPPADWRTAAAEVYAEAEGHLTGPVLTSPKVVHRHKPAPDPALTRYDKGVRLVTPVCLICGEVLAERRG